MNAIEIPFGNRTERRIALAVQLGLTLFGALLMFLSYSDGHLAGMFVGPVVAIGGLIGGGVWRRKARPRRLLVEPQGIRWDEKGVTWAVPWYELAGVALARTRTSKPSLWIDLVPVDPQAFAATYRSVLTAERGHSARMGDDHWIRLADDSGGALLDLALRRHAPQIYRGLVPHFSG